MNRLVIIGNGFDRAHHMKTSYNDFLLDYFDKCFKEAESSEQNIYSDKLIEVKRNGIFKVENFLTHIDDYLWFLFDKNLLTNKQQNRERIQQRNHVNRKMSSDYTTWAYELNFKSQFFKTLVEDLYEKNWVNIENHYYDSLIRIFQNLIDRGNQLHKLNEEFSEVIDKLEKYIFSLNTDNTIEEFNTLLKTEINLSELISLTPNERNNIEGLPVTSQSTDGGNAKVEFIIPQKTMLLNFNYTATAEKYLTNDCSINYIHKKNENEIIFGFGDEIDENYNKLEKENDNSYFKFIKSFGYFSNSNYHDLIRFIDSDMFEVFIWGHSCGLSDRTLLNSIFEHTNCKLIKIFYYEMEDGQNDYTKLTYEISRHFKDKAMMRKKILYLEKCSALPQYKKPD